MEQLPFSADDLMDVMEMTDTLEKHISETLQGNQGSLAISALMAATVNSLLAQCKSLDQVMMYRNLFMQILDTAIMGIQIKKEGE